MLELRPKTTVGNSQTRVVFDNPQPRRLLLALVLLLVALAAVVLKDQQFWFGSDQSMLDSDGPESAAASRTVTAPVAANQTRSATALTTKKRVVPRTSTAAAPKPVDAPAVATTRTVLPPLDVEVVAGDTSSKIHPGSNAAKVEITRPAAAPAQPSSTIAAATNAAEHEPISLEATRPRASYPLLAQHMNVQGSVVLQAIIGADGIIQNLHVLSGPAILSSAAQQAVREWRFKPILQNGQPVESQAKITVNFTIKVADASSTNLAESRPERSQVLSR